jgi:ABC-2 type transport system ATP-binding protein
VNLLEVSRIRKAFDGGTVAVDDLSFAIRPGEVFGLLGPNGAGKTTTMSIISGLLAPDGGELLFRGQPVTGHSDELKRALGVVPQELAIYPDLTARENLIFFARLYGARGAILKARVDLALERSGLTQNASRPARQFSGGMKRRLNFAIGLLHEPKLLMLDEPTVGVDPQSRAHLLDCVRELRDDGVSVLYASHYMEEVEAVCDRLAIIDHGRVVACGSLDELLARLHVEIRLRLLNVPDQFEQRLNELDSILSVESRQPNGRESERVAVLRTSVRARDEADIGALVEAVLNVLKTDDSATEPCRVLSVSTQESSLERLFLELTGRRLRD